MVLPIPQFTESKAIMQEIQACCLHLMVIQTLGAVKS